MTHQEKEALLKRIYALPTEWADEGGSYGKGGPVGSEDAAMLWPEAVIDAINQFADDANVARKDPTTGLVPCGCGGKAETHELYGNFSGTYMTDCKKCATGTTQYNTKKEAQDAWNTAMGLPEVEG